MCQSAGIVTHIYHETQLHISECADLGLSLQEMQNTEEHQGPLFPPFSIFCTRRVLTIFCTACTAYSRYILDVGQSEDWFALQIALLPCLLGYGRIASRLHGLQTHSNPKEANRYRRWIDNYVAEDYTEAVQKGCGKCDRGLIPKVFAC